MNIQIKYHAPITKIQVYEKGDWIDLRCAEDVILKANDFALISLGISMKVPENYEVWIAPRSSTFKKFGIIQTNSIGIIDNSYCGNNDIIKMPVLATRDVTIPADERIAQFRLMPRMSNMDVNIALGGINFQEVDDLGTEDRGGFGSSNGKF